MDLLLLNTYTSQKQLLEEKLTILQSLPDDYASYRDSSVTNITQTISELDILIAQELVNKAESETVDYIRLKELYANNRIGFVSLAKLKEYDSIYNDSNLTIEQKTLLITDKGGLYPE